MASLKEIKSRISSVQSTLKITSAMKIVASAKLHRTEQTAVALNAYVTSLRTVLEALGDKASSIEISSPLTTPHEGRQVAAIVAIASNSSLCGAFNSNAAKELHNTMAELESEGYEEIIVYTLGDKITQAARKAGYNINEYYSSIAVQPDPDTILKLATMLSKRFISGKLDRAVFVGNKFISVGRQEPYHTDLLPFSFSIEETDAQDRDIDYIIEPDAKSILEEMVPSVFRTTLYSMILNAETAEHAARTVAMQTATDNAEDLLDELRLTYNKRRQKAITDELADITQAGNN